MNIKIYNYRPVLIGVQVFIFLISLIASEGCGSPKQKARDENGKVLTVEAKYLKLIDYGDYVLAEVITPWSGGKPLASYKIDKPLEKSVVFSSVHTAAIDELGAIGCVAGVADASYFVPDDTVARLLAAGKMADVGSSMAPMVEKIIDLDCDGVLASAMEGGIDSRIANSGVPVIYLADYLEETPLARAEWIKLIGLLYGRREAADSVWLRVRQAYAEVCEKVSEVDRRPKVLTEKPYSGVWYVPGGKSYMAMMIADAGGDYVWADDENTGSLPLDEGAVIDRAADADIWLIKSGELTVAGLLGEVPHARAFSAYPSNVYFCNTVEKPFFNSVAFHPERVLEEYARIFHPELFGDSTLTFFEKLR